MWVGRIAILILAAVAHLMSVFIPWLLVTIGLVDLILFVVVSLLTPPRKKELLDRLAAQKTVFDRSY